MLAKNAREECPRGISVIDILTIAAETCFFFSLPSNTSEPPSGSSRGKCSYTENCKFNGQIFPLVASIFGRQSLRNFPVQHRLWSCSGHLKEYQARKDPLLQCDLVQKQVDKLKAWSGVVVWVIQFRRGEEHRLNVALRNGGSLESNVTPAMADQPSTRPLLIG